MTHQVQKGNDRQAERSEWVKPELQVIDTSDAEAAFNAASDGATQNS